MYAIRRNGMFESFDHNLIWSFLGCLSAVAHPYQQVRGDFQGVLASGTDSDAAASALAAQLHDVQVCAVAHVDAALHNTLPDAG